MVKNMIKKLKLDTDWLISKELFKEYNKKFETLKIKIYNKDITTNDKYKINIDSSSFIEENIFNDDKDYFVRYIDTSNRLPLKERKIIYLCYIEKDNEYQDLFIEHNMGYSLTYFYNIKKKAIIDFTIAFGVITIE